MENKVYNTIMAVWLQTRWETSMTFEEKESKSNSNNVHHNVVGGETTGNIFFFFPLCPQLSFRSKYYFHKTGFWTRVCCSTVSIFSSTPASQGACRNLKEAGNKDTEQCGTWVPPSRHSHFVAAPTYPCSFDQIIWCLKSFFLVSKNRNTTT